MAREHDDRRGSSTQRGYDSKWQRERAAFLREHPLCECDQCKAGELRLLPSSVVDHKVRPRLGEALATGDAVAIARARSLFWDRGNWQALAKQCHDSWKQRLEKSGRVAGANENGIPLDPNHHWRRGRAG